jgi:predicted dithiol-disulfide oxidoreductase (DUF899 family)
MAASNLSPPKIVSREEWLTAREAFLLKEKAMTREFDKLRAERRRLPWIKVEKSYAFESPEGKCALADLFRGRSQLAVYHFMLTPGSDHVCKGCSFVADHIDAARQHFGDAALIVEPGTCRVTRNGPSWSVRQSATPPGLPRSCSAQRMARGRC